MVKVRQNLIPKSLYSWKSPYTMKPTRIVVHNTANDASADAEIRYMHKSRTQGGRQTSFHYAVDDKEAVQGLPEDRNGWHSGDGDGKGNRQGIGIEICYSKSGGDRFINAEKNAVELIVSILKRYGWGIEKVTKHQDYANKYCPHRTLDMGWDRFINMIKAEMGETPVKKPVISNNYLKAYYLGGSLVDALKSIGVDASFTNRKKLAQANGISNYVGTPGQNTTMLSLLKQGKLKRVGASSTNTTTSTKKPTTRYLKANYNGSSIVDALKSIGVDSSFTYRSKLAKANGILNYVGTPAQNSIMLRLLKNGELRAV